MENRSFARPTASAIIDEGLRQHMLRVYNYMAGGLCATALVAYLIANTSLFHLFFTAQGMTGLGWIALMSPFIMVFAFGWILNRGTASQSQLAFWIFSVLMGEQKDRGHIGKNQQQQKDTPYEKGSFYV